MIEALGVVLTRPYFAARLTAGERKEFVESVRDNASMEPPDPTVTGVADDAEDDRVLGTAVAGRADIIVTGDKGMLAIGSFVDIPIVTARTFLYLIAYRADVTTVICRRGGDVQRRVYPPVSSAGITS